MLLILNYLYYLSIVFKSRLLIVFFMGIFIYFVLALFCWYMAFELGAVCYSYGRRSAYNHSFFIGFIINTLY